MKKKNKLTLPTARDRNRPKPTAAEEAEARARAALEARAKAALEAPVKATEARQARPIPQAAGSGPTAPERGTAGQAGPTLRVLGELPPEAAASAVVHQDHPAAAFVETLTEAVELTARGLGIEVRDNRTDGSPSAAEAAFLRLTEAGEEASGPDGPVDANMELFEGSYRAGDEELTEAERLVLVADTDNADADEQEEDDTDAAGDADAMVGVPHQPTAPARDDVATLGDFMAEQDQAIAAARDRIATLEAKIEALSEADLRIMMRTTEIGDKVEFAMSLLQQSAELLAETIGAVETVRQRLGLPAL